MQTRLATLPLSGSQIIRPGFVRRAQAYFRNGGLPPLPRISPNFLDLGVTLLASVSLCTAAGLLLGAMPQ
jgi:hypothetical protein